MRIIDMIEPCFVQEPWTDIMHIPPETCNKLFGWDSPCESIQIILRDDEPEAEFNAIIDINEEGISLAEKDALGQTHYFFPWTSIVGVQGRIRT